MATLASKYAEYKVNKAEYIKIRKAILREPEEEVGKVAEDLMIATLKAEVENLIRKKSNKAWKLYKKVYEGSPIDKDIDMFIALADELVGYEEFIPQERINVLRVSRNLVWAFKQSFKGTQDEFDQKSVLDESSS